MASELQQTMGRPAPYIFQVAVTVALEPLPVMVASVQRSTPASPATTMAAGVALVSKMTERRVRSGTLPVGPLPSVPLTSNQLAPPSVVRKTCRVRYLAWMAETPP